MANSSGQAPPPHNEAVGQREFEYQFILAPEQGSCYETAEYERVEEVNGRSRYFSRQTPTYLGKCLGYSRTIENGHKKHWVTFKHGNTVHRFRAPTEVEGDRRVYREVPCQAGGAKKKTRRSKKGKRKSTRKH